MGALGRRRRRAGRAEPDAPSAGGVRGDRLDGGDAKKGLLPDGTSEECDGPDDPYSDRTAALLRRGYAAAISHVDGLAGGLVALLDGLGLRNDTVVVVTSDHGYSLGEQNAWTKSSLYEAAARVPLLVRAPWLRAGAPRRPVHLRSLVELADLYRTLADLAVARPETVAGGVQGASLAPLLRNVSAAAGTAVAAAASPWRRFVVSQFPRCPDDEVKPWDKNSCKQTSRADIAWMGYALRHADGWRYTRWLRWDAAARAPAACAWAETSRSTGEAELASAGGTTELYRIDDGDVSAQADYDRSTERRNLAGSAEYEGHLAWLNASLYAWVMQSQHLECCGELVS